MPIPDKPYTRREAYLNAAATGDSSGIPETPYTREEMYLDAIAKGGGGGGGGGSSTLAGLTDVDISNPTDGQVLVYNAESGKWENGAGGGGGALVVHAEEVGANVVLDHTYAEIVAAAPFVSLMKVDVNRTVVTWLGAFGPYASQYLLQFGTAIFGTDAEDGYPVETVI